MKKENMLSIRKVKPLNIYINITQNDLITRKTFFCCFLVLCITWKIIFVRIFVHDILIA